MQNAARRASPNPVFAAIFRGVRVLLGKSMTSAIIATVIQKAISTEFPIAYVYPPLTAAAVLSAMMSEGRMGCPLKEDT